MNKIRFIADREANYVFHMLSVAGCGYDNNYGRAFRGLYPTEDIAVLKSNEELLTVCGGEHCGALYGLAVCTPACGKTSAKEYYAKLLREAESGSLPGEVNGYSDIVAAISSVMIKHYDYYVENIWDIEKEKILGYIPSVSGLFERSEFTEKAEIAVGCALQSDYFTATLVTSVQNGAEAIDISRELDLFGIVRDPVDAFYFMGHEFIIYLLMEALKGENAFHSFNTWGLTEGLAEYYLKLILGDTRFFDSERQYAEFYEKCAGNEKLSAAELYRKALSYYGK